MPFEDNVTGGVVSFHDAVKQDTGGDPQYWPTRRAGVELRFEVYEGEDGVAVVDAIIEIARVKVSDMLGTTSRTATEATTTSAAAAAGAAPRRTRQSKDKAPEPTLAPEPKTPAADPLAGLNAAPSAEPQPEPKEPAPSTPPTAAGDLTDILGGAAPAPEPVKEISDDEIVHAVMARNEALKDASKIRALVESYNPQPGLRVFKATEIAQADRAGFIEKLAAL